MYMYMCVYIYIYMCIYIYIYIYICQRASQADRPATKSSADVCTTTRNLPGLAENLLGGYLRSSLAPWASPASFAGTPASDLYEELTRLAETRLAETRLAETRLAEN